MKIKDIVCDICGESCEWHGSYIYTIRKRFWEMEVLGRRVDLCQDCWKKMQEWIIKEQFKERSREKEKK